MDHRNVSIQFLRSSGLIPVKVRPRQKDPFAEWDPRLASVVDADLTIAEITHKTELNLGALFHGRYVDLDVDSDSPFIGAALDFFLPRTPYIWGRKSKPRSHRVYGLHEDFDRAPYGPILRYLKKLTSGEIDEVNYSVEIRGGKPENGLFSVLPGSIHPSGENVEWSNTVDPTIGGAFVEFPTLLRCIRLAVATALVAPYWSAGNRNDMSLAVAGVFWRIRASTLGALGLTPDEDAPEGTYVLTYEDAEKVYECLLAIADDNKGDHRQRMLNLRNSWRKLEGDSGARVSGGKVLAELMGGERGAGPKIVRALYRLLSDNEAAETVERLSEEYVMWYGPGVIIDLKMVTANRANPWMTREQAMNSMGGKTVKIGEKRIPTAQLLFTSPIIHRVGGLTFDPSTVDLVVNTPEGAMVNQWRGFSIAPVEQSVKFEQIEKFHAYVTEIIADGDENAAHWVFAWMADFLQNPSKKPGTALVLVGSEGAGKTFLGERVLGRIIGPHHYGQTNSVTTLTHNFNTIIDNKILIQCDEAVHSYQKDVASRLKSLITDETFKVEPKGINAYVKPNHMRFLFTSNEEHAAIFISASKYERRFTVLRVPPKRAGKANLPWWTDFRAWTEASLPLIAKWLMSYKYDRAVIMRPYETEAKKELQRTGLDIEVQWIIARIAEGFPLGDRIHQHWFDAYREGTVTDKDRTLDTKRRDLWPNRISLPLLEDDFKQFIRSMGKPVYTGSLMTTIKRVLPINSTNVVKQLNVSYSDHRTEQVVKERIRVYNFPPAQDIVAHLSEKFGSIVEEELKEKIVEIEEEEPSQSRGEV